MIKLVDIESVEEENVTFGTCGEIVVMTKEQKLFELREAYDIEVEKTVGLFREVK